jgi:hypothetical protein
MASLRACPSVKHRRPEHLTFRARPTTALELSAQPVPMPTEHGETEQRVPNGDDQIVHERVMRVG